MDYQGDLRLASLNLMTLFAGRLVKSVLWDFNCLRSVTRSVGVFRDWSQIYVQLEISKASLDWNRAPLDPWKISNCLRCVATCQTIPVAEGKERAQKKEVSSIR